MDSNNYPAQTKSGRHALLSAGKISLLPILFAMGLLIGAVVFRPLLQLSKHWLGKAFAVEFIGILVLLGALWFLWDTVKKKRYARLSALAALAAISAGSLLLPIAEERIHLLKYGLLASLIYRDLSKANRVTTAAVGGFLGASWVGTLDEFVQLFAPQRVADPRDILINALGAASGILIVSLCRFPAVTEMRKLH
jgi:hypothetical protein